MFGCSLVLWLLLSVLSQDIRAQGSYRQTTVDFHAAGDPAVPAPLGTGALSAVASDGARWAAGKPGLYRNDPKAAPADRVRYFASRRWLPDDDVRHLYPDRDGGMWAQTATGIAHIRFQRMTLAGKAALFENRIRQRHLRHGFVAGSILQEPGVLASSQTHTTDNDGLWTAIYAAAECFRYAVTRSPEALDYARQAVTAILDLEPVTGRPGLFARSILHPNEAGASSGMWNWDPQRKARWKADTSSDEVVGHYLIFAVAWDLLPDAALRARIEGAVRRVTDHLLDHGLMLTDVHGQPAWWGRWDEEYFASARGLDDGPLNAIEILSFLKTAHHITGEPRYASEYQRLAADRGYARLGERYLERRKVINYSDEELAMLSFYPLLSYEKNAELVASYRRSLNAWWRNIGREKNPLWIAIYEAGGGGPVNLADALWTLQRIPMDLVSWTVTNSHREGIEWEPEMDRFARRQSRTLLPPDERPVMKWNGNPFRVDGGNAGRTEDDGAFFLLPYWLGRYHRLWSE